MQFKFKFVAVKSRHAREDERVSRIADSKRSERCINALF